MVDVAFDREFDYRYLASKLAVCMLVGVWLLGGAMPRAEMAATS